MKQTLGDILRGQNSIEITKSTENSYNTKIRRYRDHFGVSPYITSIIWGDILHTKNFSPYAKKEHLLWALYYLKKKCTESDAHKTFGMDEKTFRKWKYDIILRISKLNRVS